MDHAIIEDLGGEDQISAQRRALLELAVRTKLLLDGIDAYLLEMPSLVNKRDRRVFEVVRDRMRLSDSLWTCRSPSKAPGPSSRDSRR